MHSWITIVRKQSFQKCISRHIDKTIKFRKLNEILNKQIENLIRREREQFIGPISGIIIKK